MLHEILSSNRTALIDRCKAKVALRPARGVRDSQLRHGIPQFIDQLIETMRREQSRGLPGSARISGPPGAAISTLSGMAEAAALHGKELLARGFTVDEVVHDFGDLCQALTELVLDLGLGHQIDVAEFHTLNRCLNNAITGVVREYSYATRAQMEEEKAAANERQAFFVHEVRNLLNNATLAFAVLKSGRAGVNGATGAIVESSLQRLAALVARSITDVRANTAMAARHELVPLSAFVTDVQRCVALEAAGRGCTFLVSRVNPSLAIDVDRDLMFGALSNLLTNAFKFTCHGTEVTLNAYALADRILIDVSDNCGGLPAGVGNGTFTSFTQLSDDRSGLGVGLALTNKSIEGNQGVLRVRNLPGTGCVFTIDLPRHGLPDAFPTG